jgi:hypothetical protein
MVKQGVVLSGEGIKHSGQVKEGVEKEKEPIT